MTMKSKWLEPGGVAAIVTIAIAVGGLFFSAAAVVQANSVMATNFDRMSGKMEALQNQLAAIPTQDMRLRMVETSLADNRRDAELQKDAIGGIKQDVAVLNSKMDAVSRNVQALQDVANSRLPVPRR